MNPKVSLILTTYNSMPYIEQTLSNIAKQDYDNLEIVIKDGISTDGTIDIIKNYQTQGMPIIWESKKDIGIYDAMNQGYMISSGEIIAFFNDQFTEDNAITLLVNAIREGGTDCIGVHANLIYADGERIIRYWRMKQGKIKNGWMPGHPTLFLKRNIYEQYGLYKTDYVCSADYEFMVRVLKNQEDKLAYVDKTLVKMYYGGTSTSGLGSYVVSLKEGHRALKENQYRRAFSIDIYRTWRVLLQFLLKKVKGTYMSGNKKIIQINTVCNNSTGHIMHHIQVAAEQNEYETLSIVGRRKVYSDVPCVKYGNFFSFWIHVGITTIFDKQGWGSYLSTKRIVNRLRKEQPDIIHLHNIHGYYLNLPVLFHYLCEEFKGQVVWTFHDCWPFTGHCPYYTMAGCNKWKTECYHCTNKRLYPTSLLFDASRSNYRWKKKMFGTLHNLTILVPSNWVYAQVKQSFFKDAPIYVVPNGIDFNMFYPVDGKTIRENYRIKDKKILLGVASIWEERKGLGDFLNLSDKLSEEYVIILVGLNARQCRKLPPNVIGIQRTENVSELVQLYSAADVFINPLREETFSMVTIEAMACGTPVIVRAGSATEELVTEECGRILKDSCIDELLEKIAQLVATEWKKEKIIEHAQLYSQEQMTNKVMKTYNMEKKNE